MKSTLLLLLALAGCGPSVSTIALADGRPAYRIKCGGLFDAKIDCNLAATEYCPGGYQPVSSSSGRLTAVCGSKVN